MFKPNISKDALAQFIETCHNDNCPDSNIVAQIHQFCLDAGPVPVGNTIILGGWLTGHKIRKIYRN